MSRDLYSEVTERILAELKTGAAPWVKPWSATPGQNHPHNAATGRPYSGCNVILLWITMQANHFAAPRFLTYQQAIGLGAHVRKGEKGTKVYFVKQLVVKDKTSSEPNATRVVPMLREYTVFNIAQCEGLPARITNPETKAPRNKDSRDETIDAFMLATRADIREGYGEAYYRPSEDYVSLPAFLSFKNADSFYATSFHELGHWSGHKTRLNRDLKNRFGDKAYAAEELIAELCAAFLCAEFNLDSELRHAGYIQHWIQLLTSDARAFFTAASKAQAAADFLRGLALRETESEESELAA
jgi:antirestriction protein ArdC